MKIQKGSILNAGSKTNIRQFDLYDRFLEHLSDTHRIVELPKLSLQHQSGMGMFVSTAKKTPGDAIAGLYMGLLVYVKGNCLDRPGTVGANLSDTLHGSSP